MGNQVIGEIEEPSPCPDSGKLPGEGPRAGCDGGGAKRKGRERVVHGYERKGEELSPLSGICLDFGLQFSCSEPHNRPRSRTEQNGFGRCD